MQCIRCDPKTCLESLFPNLIQALHFWISELSACFHRWWILERAYMYAPTWESSAIVHTCGRCYLTNMPCYHEYLSIRSRRLACPLSLGPEKFCFILSFSSENIVWCWINLDLGLVLFATFMPCTPLQPWAYAIDRLEPSAKYAYVRPECCCFQWRNRVRPDHKSLTRGPCRLGMCPKNVSNRLWEHSDKSANFIENCDTDLF